ncbi:hypothetical protein NQ318_006493 [Aromia moschata]|uniref:INO80 complex subunit B-like conserved region domain-containing protein n=1 Tax=Aromia moschata TaxID=1265417 RepID=A0AAV8YNC0_9CUCU|nr:hypothetical protein NQ318_006493 [Aromia moschata]
MTAEAIQKAAIKSLKRKQLADEKREKDKKKTMERLLKKQDSKAAKQAKSKVTKSTVPSIVYRQNLNVALVTFPEGYDYPLKPRVASEPPSRRTAAWVTTPLTVLTSKTLSTCKQQLFIPGSTKPNNT